MTIQQKIEEARTLIASRAPLRPAVGMILGSGIGSFADQLTDPVIIPYGDIPHFATTSVKLHAGELLIGQLSGEDVVAMSGRFHYYEGHSLDAIAFPILVMHSLGIRSLIITNACGAINSSYTPSDIMLISDHINTSGLNPLRGPDTSLGDRFPDMSAAYSPQLRELAHNIAEAKDIEVREGVYAWWPGPSLESPAEIRMLRTMGADAVGMSTVPEVLVAKYVGIEVLGIACIGNMASGMSSQVITAEDVARTVALSAGKLTALVHGVVQKLHG